MRVSILKQALPRRDDNWSRGDIDSGIIYTAPRVWVEHCTMFRGKKRNPFPVFDKQTQLASGQ